MHPWDKLINKMTDFKVENKTNYLKAAWAFLAQLPKEIHKNDDWLQQGVIHVTSGVILKMNADDKKFTSNSDLNWTLSIAQWSMMRGRMLLNPIDEVRQANEVVIFNGMRVR